MRNPLHTPAGAVWRAEALFNSRRVAPYAMAALFAGNALLWWGWGPAATYGWATNSEHFTVRNLVVYSFMTLPLFTALLMGDPVSRDFRTGIAPLILSKPVTRAGYLLGKFAGNFFVLVLCQAAFPLMQLVLQVFRPEGMLVQEARVVPYLKHFLFFVVVSHLALAAIFFTVGALTRNAKIVYGLAVAFYPLYISWQMLMRGWPTSWRIALDPLLMNWDIAGYRGRSAEFLNGVTVSYTGEMLFNRALMVSIAVGCLVLLCSRFKTAERFKGRREQSHTLTLGLAPEAAPGLSREPESLTTANTNASEPSTELSTAEKQALPEVRRTNGGLRAGAAQLGAATRLELRLLLTERSLVLLLPLAVFLSTFELAFWPVAVEVSRTAAYAGRSASVLLLFLLGYAIFYTSEAMHRDRELRLEPMLWSTPAPNHVLLLSKFLSTLALLLTMTALVALTAAALQLFKGDGPVEPSVYLYAYGVILLPGVALLVGIMVALNVLLGEKHLALAAGIALCGGLFYLYGRGFRHWLYNPVMYGLWTEADLASVSGREGLILLHRFYCLALIGLGLAVAHLCFERRAARGLWVGGRLSGAGWAALLMLLSLLAASLSGLLIWRG